jgi:hypothetical protein
MTTASAVIAALLTFCLTFFGSQALIGSINLKLGFPDNKPYPTVYCKPDPELLKAATEKNPAEKPLQILARQLREADSKKKEERTIAQYQTICAAHQAFFNIAAKRTSNSRSSAPGILPCQDCDAVAAAISRDSQDTSGVTTDRGAEMSCEVTVAHDLDWMEPRCVLERIHSVRPKYDGEPGLAILWKRIVMASATTSGLQGNMYVFEHSRTVKYAGDPDRLDWGSATSTSLQSPDRHTSDVQDLQVALGRFDKLVLPRLKQIENSVWLQRFFLQALNNWMQAGMVWLGFWAALIYIWDWINAIRRKYYPHALVQALASEYPHGVANPMPAPEPPPPAQNVYRLAYSSELRNVMDATLAGWQLRGRVVADTLYEWIPIIGFIGTVVGMIGAIDAIGEVIHADQGPELYTAMGGVTSQLMLAFYTTFIGLVLSAILSLLRRYCIATEHAAVEAAAAHLRA